VVRIVLGLGQMIGASTTFLLFIKTGVSDVVLVALGVTCILTTVSLLLFDGQRGNWSR
jgi:hypothetical protein